jgi:predicted amidophosphoribosyltransferase
MGLQESSIFFQQIRHRHYFLCHYLPLASGIDTVSRSLLKFKRGAQPDLDNWLNRALACFHEIQPCLPPATIIVRALHHKETLPGQDRPSSLDRLGRALSASLHFRYLPHLLQKSRPTTINQGLTRPQRETELRDVYSLNPAALPGPLPPNSAAAPPAAPTSILLIDDILTTGATVLSILKTLHATWPGCTIIIFTLAKVA